METIEHFAKISLVARLLGGERLLSRDEVARLEKLRGSYGIAAPAPICPEPTNADPVDCQVVQSPVSPSGARLVADALGAIGHESIEPRSDIGPDAEIRLTYSELTALIEDAVRNLK
jgi:hypothetical protein